MIWPRRILGGAFSTPYFTRPNFDILSPMSQYYKPNRKPERNYGGPNWKLSRSKIDLFLECPRCFYLDNRLGVARPPGFPFTLNSAVDRLLKKEFDIHRAGRTAHPLM